MNSSSYGNGASTFQPSKSNERSIYTVDGNKNTSYNDDDEDEFCWFARTFCCCITNRNKTSS